jgi:hypothetical protein
MLSQHRNGSPASERTHEASEMMPIAATGIWKVGPYTVQSRPRFDSPAWAVYIVFRGDKLIGKCFSMPDVGWCNALERQLKFRVEDVVTPKPGISGSVVRGLDKARLASLTSRRRRREAAEVE